MARFCLGMLSLGAALYLGLAAYGTWFNHGLLNPSGPSQKADILGVTLQYPIAMTLLVILSLTFAFAAVYALFFPTRSSN